MKIKCKCGCGVEREQFDSRGRERFYLKGHGIKVNVKNFYQSKYAKMEVL
jgi:hypothetical protein